MEQKVIDLIPADLREQLIKEVLEILEERKNNPSNEDILNEIKEWAEQKK